MRIAWIGTPASGGGVGGICRLFLRELAKLPVELDVFSSRSLEDAPDLRNSFVGNEKRFLPFLYSWDWNSWYGRNRRLAFIVSFLKRLPLHGRIVKSLLEEHHRQSYDAVIQFSQGELFSLGKHVDDIPVILFPCVHAAGELEWCRREEPLARRCESWFWRKLRNLYLAYRARLQKRDYRLARGVIGMSYRFNRCVQQDYGLPQERMGVVYHPIEVARLPDLPPVSGGAIRLLFVGRVSVRKGIEFLVEVIPSILGTHSDVEVTVIGAGSLWSDYEPLLDDLPAKRCRWLKSLRNEQVTEEMHRSHILLVPSLYEPGGIVVGEALANGMIIVATDEVGSAENLPRSVCHEFRAGDAIGFRKAIEGAIAEIRARGESLRTVAITVAREQFEPKRMAELLLSEVSRLIGGRQAECANRIRP